MILQRVQISIEKYYLKIIKIRLRLQCTDFSFEICVLIHPLQFKSETSIDFVDTFSMSGKSTRSSIFPRQSGKILGRNAKDLESGRPTTSL